MRKFSILLAVMVIGSMVLGACAAGEDLPTAPTITTPLVVAYEEFSQKFSPFFGDTAYDMDVAGMT